MHYRRGLLSAFVVIAALFAAWQVFQPRRAPEFINDLACARKPGPGQPPPTRTEPESLKANLADTVAAFPADKARTSPPVLDAAADLDHPPLWQPDYGDGLKRSGGKIEFDVTDAMGKLIVNRGATHVRLWRKPGQYAFNIGPAYDMEQGVLACSNLEPGDYDAEIGIGQYGVVRHSFNVGRSEQVRGRIALPNWERIICLRFVDSHGQPVPWLYQSTQGGPRNAITGEGKPLDAVKRGLPGGVLREPPVDGDGIGGSSGGFTSRRSSTSSRHTEGKLATDNGRFYLRAIAGATNTITIPLLPEIWGQQTLTLTDNCTGPQWDDYIIRLELVPDFDQRLAAKAILDGIERDVLPAELLDDPGRRSLLSPPPQKAPPDPRSMATIGARRSRLLLTVDDADQLIPVYRLTDSAKQQDFIPSKRHGNTWVIDFDQGHDIEFFLTDFKLYDGAAQRVAMKGISFRELNVGAEGLPARIKFNLPSPTLNASALSATLALHAKGQTLPVGPRTDDSLTYSSNRGKSLGEGRRPLVFGRDASGQLTLHTRIGPALREALTGGDIHLKATVSRVAGTAIIGDADIALSDEQTANLAAGALTIEIKPSGLMLRAVGPTQGGLPWVEGSVIEYEQAALCEELRGLLPAIAGNPALPHSNARADKGNIARMSDDELRTTMGDKLYDALKTRAAREHVFFSDAWYDTRARVGSDYHGYIFANHFRLQPGKRYVLYLWSASRDEYAPDLRLDFVAGDGVTDLGAVLLPDYR